MGQSYRARVASPADARRDDVGANLFADYRRRFLAQGDSWFSIGSFPPGLTSNVLDELELSQATVIVNCAVPGKVLQNMATITRAPIFTRLLAGRFALKWDAILLSGGGNDLIDAASVGPDAKPQHRLLATPQERPEPIGNVDDYLSEKGWQTFAGDVGRHFHTLVELRDRDELNRRVPLFLHAYAHLTPRPVGAGAGFGPWLAPTLSTFKVPRSHWQAVSDALLDRLATLLLSLVKERRRSDAKCAIHLIDTRRAGLDLAAPKAPGASGDFLNEIHPTRVGYQKLAAMWRRELESVLP